MYIQDYRDRTNQDYLSVKKNLADMFVNGYQKTMRMKQSNAENLKFYMWTGIQRPYGFSEYSKNWVQIDPLTVHEGMTLAIKYPEFENPITIPSVQKASGIIDNNGDLLFNIESRNSMFTNFNPQEFAKKMEYELNARALNNWQIRNIAKDAIQNNLLNQGKTAEYVGDRSATVYVDIGDNRMQKVDEMQDWMRGRQYWIMDDVTNEVLDYGSQLLDAKNITIDGNNYCVVDNSSCVISNIDIDAISRTLTQKEMSEMESTVIFRSNQEYDGQEYDEQGPSLE